jgi:hypothetical protein
LFDAGHEFVVISPGIGGRVLQSEDGALPLGAMYVRADYEHVNRFVIRGRRFNARRRRSLNVMGGPAPIEMPDRARVEQQPSRPSFSDGAP